MEVVALKVASSNTLTYLASPTAAEAAADALGSNGHQHTADCGSRARAWGRACGGDLYAGFTSLPEFANICDARQARRYGRRRTRSHQRRMGSGWRESGCTPGGPPPRLATCERRSSSMSRSIMAKQQARCPGATSNGSGGFAFHFSCSTREGLRLRDVYVGVATARSSSATPGARHVRNVFAGIGLQRASVRLSG
jgi:hypothetical protein